MLSRARTVQLRNGASFETPLLVPSLSTRGVMYLEHEIEPGVLTPTSVASIALELFGTMLSESLLISAFDLHNHSLFESEQLLKGAANTVFSHPELLLVDSGLYETRRRVPPERDTTGGEWDEGLYRGVLDRLPNDLRVAIVNFDQDASELGQAGAGEIRKLPYGDQLAAARRLFADFPEAASVMLLKPERQGGFIEVDALTPLLKDLREFDIIAVTEKELGDDLHTRLKTLAVLRKELDTRDVDRPLHVFGGLDPLLTPLYFAFGAEIVDGLSWLRYAYLPDDAAHCMESRAVLEAELDTSVRQRISGTLADNLVYLQGCKRRLRVLQQHQNWLEYSAERGKVLSAVFERVYVEVK